MSEIKLNISMIMECLESLGKEQTKRTYLRHGAKEPLFGVTTGDLKPLAKRVGKNYELSLQLYDTGNYDAMYFAGMICEPEKMTREDFETWMQEAYCHGLSDYVVSVTLAESPLAQEMADRWIRSEKELYASGGWSCYAWLLGYKKDADFDKEKLQGYLDEIEETIHSQPNRVRYAMNNFVITVGISYMPLHEEAVRTANRIGEVAFDKGETNCKIPLAADYIQRAADRNRLGFKRKKVRC